MCRWISRYWSPISRSPEGMSTKAAFMVLVHRSRAHVCWLFLGASGSTEATAWACESNPDGVCELNGPWPIPPPQPGGQAHFMGSLSQIYDVKTQWLGPVARGQGRAHRAEGAYRTCSNVKEGTESVLENFNVFLMEQRKAGLGSEDVGYVNME